MHSESQKFETLKFRDELGGNIVPSFVALKSKLYSLADLHEMSAKGTTKFAQKSLQHAVFYRVFANGTLLRTLNYTIPKDTDKKY